MDEQVGEVAVGGDDPSNQVAELKVRVYLSSCPFEKIQSGYSNRTQV